MLPTERYQHLLDADELSADPAQAAIAQRFDVLMGELVGQAKQGLWRSFRSRLKPTEPVRGLYLWGGVGRGKTMLMDLFYDCLPEGLGVRMHFHRFMHRVHKELTSLAGTANPLEEVADGFAQQGKVICFDEFFVSDIGDAMILGELLRHLFDRGVTLVATSNVEPSGLYNNGLQRRRFLPAIELLQTHTEVVHLDTAVDYRLRVLSQAEIYHSPLDATAHEQMEANFIALAPHTPERDVALSIEGRDIPALALSDDVVWFDFTALCEGPRSATDYIELSREFHAVLLSEVPVLDAKREDAARRFVSLVDEFYERNVKLMVSAAVPVLELYQGERLRFEFERTTSRLIEMQSQEYLARSHLG